MTKSKSTDHLFGDRPPISAIEQLRQNIPSGTDTIVIHAILELDQRLSAIEAQLNQSNSAIAAIKEFCVDLIDASIKPVETDDGIAFRFDAIELSEGITDIEAGRIIPGTHYRCICQSISKYLMDHTDECLEKNNYCAENWCKKNTVME